MDELEKLFADYKTGRTKYPQERAKAEDAFFRGILDQIADILNDFQTAQPVTEKIESLRRGPGRPPKVKTEESVTNG